MSGQIDARVRERVCRWKKSGEPGLWIESHQGRWGHEDWLSLLNGLQQTDFWPMEPTEVGTALEEEKTEQFNFHRWQDSGQPRQWVAAQHGTWTHDDWQALLGSLQKSEFWPM